MGSGATGRQQPAGGTVTVCQAGTTERPAKFCDVDRIELKLAIKDGPTHTVSNTVRKAGQSKPANLPRDHEAWPLLDRYSAVIAIETDYAVAGRAGAGQFDGGNKAQEKFARASVKTSASERCELHPAVMPYSKDQFAQRGLQSEDILMSIETEDFEYTKFFAQLWKWTGFSELVSPATIEQEFTVAGCAAPSSGAARGSFTALARMTARDEWRLEYALPAGLTLKFARSETSTAYHGGASETSSSTKLAGRAGDNSADYESSSNSYRSGASSSSSSSATIAAKDSTTTLSVERKTASLSAVGEVDPGAEHRFGKAVDDMDDEGPGRAKALGDKLSSATGSGKAALRVMRNGADLSTADVAGMVKRVTDTAEAVGDAIDLARQIINGGLKAAAPASVTATIGFEFSLFAGTAGFRHWRIPTAPITGPAYYIDTSDCRWTLGVSLTLASGSLNVGIEGQMKFIAAWIASATLSVEAKCTGSAELAFDIGKGDAPVAISGNGWYGATVSATGDITVAAYYGTVTGQVEGGVRYIYEGNFDSLDLKPKRSSLRSERTTFSVKIMRGNKLAEFFGYSENKKSYKWPPDGPLVLFEDDQFVKDFL